MPALRLVRPIRSPVPTIYTGPTLGKSAGDVEQLHVLESVQKANTSDNVFKNASISAREPEHFAKVSIELVSSLCVKALFEWAAGFAT